MVVAGGGLAAVRPVNPQPTVKASIAGSTSVRMGFPSITRLGPEETGRKRLAIPTPQKPSEWSQDAIAYAPELLAAA